MKIEIEISEKNEWARAPWWIIVDPRQNFHVGNEGMNNIAQMITGPFFSREEAEAELKNRRYDYSQSAAVYCKSGAYSGQYEKKISEAEKRIKNQNVK